MRLIEKVAEILAGGTAGDILRHLPDEQVLLDGTKMFVDPEEPDTESFELLSWAVNRFQLADCNVSEGVVTAATFDGQTHRLALIEAAGPIYDDPETDGSTPMVGVLGTLLFDSVEHLRAVHAATAAAYRPQVAAATIQDLALPDCDLARRLHVDVTPLIDSLHEEMLFLATVDDRLLLMLTNPLAASRSDPHAEAFDRIRPRVLTGASVVTEKMITDPHGSIYTDDLASMAQPPRVTVADVADVFDEHGTNEPLQALIAGRIGPLDGTPCTLFDPHQPDKQALRALARATDELDHAQSVCELIPVSTTSSSDNPFVIVVLVVQQWRVSYLSGGPDDSQQPAAIVGMLLLDTVEHLRQVRNGNGKAYDHSHLVTVQSALDSPSGPSPDPIRSDADGGSGNRAVEFVWAVVSEGLVAEDGGRGEAAAVVATSHDPLGDDPVSNAVGELLLDVRQRALANAAAELATTEQQRLK